MLNPKTLYDELIQTYGLADAAAPASKLATRIDFIDYDRDFLLVFRDELLKEAKSTNPEVARDAKLFIGRLYASRLGNVRLGVNYLTDSANAGHFLAQYSLGEFYSYNKNPQYDLSKAIFWLEKAVEQGHVKSMGLLGNLYIDEKINEDKGRKLIERAAEMGLGAYCLQAAFMALEEKTDHYDMEKAIKFLELGSKCEDPESATQAKLYLGKVLEVHFKEYDLALALYQQAANEGEPFGLYNQATLYTELEENEKALDYFCQAAAYGFHDSQLVAALFYREGIGTEKNVKKAIEILKQAIKNPNSEIAALAKYNLGCIYKQDFNEPLGAVMMWELAAQDGEPKARYNLAFEYTFGDTGLGDLDIALDWCRQLQVQEQLIVPPEQIEWLMQQIELKKTSM